MPKIRDLDQFVEEIDEDVINQSMNKNTRLAKDISDWGDRLQERRKPNKKRPERNIELDNDF